MMPTNVKYFENFPPIFIIALGLNPRVNFKGVIKNVTNTGQLLSLDNRYKNKDITNFEDTFNELYIIYDNEYSSRDTSHE